ncbi:MAG TPA: serine/threonine-protein kinase [Bryobacteraceae bacterium]|nr:serine/threonine-protein kinase [Bryobacteraceae bacterium]
MTPERWAQIRQIFDGAVERPEVDRAAYLRVTCARDDELRREVESLLSSHESAGDFLDKPAANICEALSGTTRTLVSSSVELPEYPPGYRVGPYELQKCIGRGGMGSVWLATRFDSDFKKKVAIKLVKRGMDTQEILRRFRLERQVLAGLTHSNIAALIDGGSTPDGLPYLVMEYVEGIRIDRYCETHKSTITERLKLFRDVCAAVQYAHGNLVVHRDLKAGNILVTAEGVPKLLDFGIAKLIRTEFSTLAAAETRPELRPMTLDYASPEQVRGEPITTATDVYSLGVLLYKLLTGKSPYGPGTRSDSALRKAICEQEPLKPSAVVLSDEKAVIPQATQKIDISEEETRDKARRRLKKKLAGDLDMIVLMALRKDALRRYASVEQFSEDIRRYLEGRPVIARSDTFGYRATRFVRRNAAAVAAAAVVAVTMFAATIFEEQSAARAALKEAAAEERIKVIEAESLRQQIELSNSYYALAESQNPAAALQTYRAALASFRAFERTHPGDQQASAFIARTAMKVAELAPEEALNLFTEARSRTEPLANADPGDYLAALLGLGRAQLKSRDVLGSLASFSRALQVAEAHGNRRDLAASNYWVGTVLAYNGETEAGAAKLRKAFELYRDLAGRPVNSVEDSPAGYRKALADLAAQAPPDLRKAIEIQLREFAPG